MILDRLQGVRAAGDDRWTARCPSHDDRQASLSIAHGEDRWLLYCHAGCLAGQIVADLGLALSDLFDEGARPAVASPGCLRVPGPAHERSAFLPRARPLRPVCDEDDVTRWATRLQDHDRLLERIHARKGWTGRTLAALSIGFDGRRLTLPVRAPTGELLGVLRYLPDGDPKMLATRGAPRELWPPPETVDGPLLLVEGEPDAISGYELGFNTVATPGAAAWRDRWTDRLAGREIIVVADCDEPGRAAATRIAAHLAGRATVNVIDLDPERQDGHDLGDEMTAARVFGDLGLRQLRRRILEIAGDGTFLSGRPDNRRGAAHG